MKHLLNGSWIISLALLLIGLPSSAQIKTEMYQGHQVVAGEVLVGLKPGSPASQTASMRADIQQKEDVDIARRVGSGRAFKFHSRSKNVSTLIQHLSARQDIQFVEPNYIIHLDARPNDPLFGSQWGLSNTGQTVDGVVGIPNADIGTVSAWDITVGSLGVVVGVVDSGIDYTHPDLAPNMWSAPTDFTVNIAGEEITCPAGSHGFNAITLSCNPADDEGHGTHVAGIIGARGADGFGVAGVNWFVNLMGLKFIDVDGNGSTEDAINAMDFAIQAKTIFGLGANVRILNNSWGGFTFSQALQNEIFFDVDDAGMLFVAAAGNEASNNDLMPFYPASYSLPNVISVAASDNRDALASFSNFGHGSVHLTAPGVDILSTVPGTWDFLSGTSMAAPFVSGAAALILSACPAFNTSDLRNNILSNVDLVPPLFPVTIQGGRLNVNKSVRACAAPPPPPPPPNSADFALSVSPASQSVANGISPTFRIDITALKGTNGQYGFQILGLPASASAAFAPATLSNAGSVTVELFGVSTGTYHLTFQVNNGSNPPTTHSVSATLTVQPSFTLTVNVDAGSGTVFSQPSGIACLQQGGTCQAVFTQGTIVNLTPSNTGGWILAKWAGACSGSGGCTVTMNQNQNVTASFGPAWWPAIQLILH